jgi:uncharacterized damage-inducible protein DinB
MSPVSEKFIAASRHSLSLWHGRLLGCLDRLSEEQIWWRGAETSNAVGNLVLHLCGNVRQWIISGVGKTPDTRDRDAEFAQREAIPTDELKSRLAAVVAEADRVLAELTDDDLLQTRHIQVYDVTVLEAVHHVTEHFALHAGQILYATKLLTGADLGFYRHLSKAHARPMGGSEQGV